MSIFKQTVQYADEINRLMEEIDYLNRSERPIVEYHNKFTVRSHLREQEGIGSAEEIESQPIRTGHVIGDEPMPIVFVKIKGQWIPTLYRHSSGDMGRVVNRKRDVNMRVSKEQLQPLSDKQKNSQAVQQIKQKYPKASFYVHTGSQGNQEVNV